MTFFATAQHQESEVVIKISESLYTFYNFDRFAYGSAYDNMAKSKLMETFCTLKKQEMMWKHCLKKEKRQHVENGKQLSSLLPTEPEVNAQTFQIKVNDKGNKVSIIKVSGEKFDFRNLLCWCLVRYYTRMPLGEKNPRGKTFPLLEQLECIKFTHERCLLSSKIKIVLHKIDKLCKICCSLHPTWKSALDSFWGNVSSPPFSSFSSYTPP